MRKQANSKSEGDTPGVNLGDGSNDFGLTCAKREGDIYIKLRRFFGLMTNRPLTPIERLKQFNHLGNMNTSGLGAVD